MDYISDRKGKELSVSWRKFYQQLKHDFRMSDIQLARQCSLDQTTLNRIASGKTKRPQLSTIKQIEDGLSIVIDDLDINNIKYRKLDGDDPLVKHLKTTISQPKAKTYPLITDHGKFIHYLRGAKVISVEQLQKIADTNVLLAYHSDNAIAVAAETDRNMPFILKGDVILVDLGEPISDQDWVAVVLKDDRYFFAQITKYDESSIFSFANSRYNPIPVHNREIRFIAKVVKISRTL